MSSINKKIISRKYEHLCQLEFESGELVPLQGSKLIELRPLHNISEFK